MVSLQQSSKKEKMNNEILENLKSKLIKLEEKARKLNNDRNLLVNILNDLNRKTNTKLNNSLYGIDLQEEISYLSDWIEFHSGYIDNCRIKLKRIEENNYASVEEITPNIKEKIIKVLDLQKPSVKYILPFIILLLIMTSLFLLKPAITGHVILTEETTYNENLNLQLNESGIYQWNVKNPGNIKSLKASGGVIGNGTVKVYIEKDGNKYIIYQNK